MHTADSIAAKLVIAHPTIRHRRSAFLISFASLYTILPAEQWISVTKAGICHGGSSGIGQKWCSDFVKSMIDKGYLETKKSGPRQWVRPFDATALLVWANSQPDQENWMMDLRICKDQVETILEK